MVRKATTNTSSGSKVRIEIPTLKRTEIKLLLVGDRPLLVNNKSSQLVTEMTERYGRGNKSKAIVKDSPD